MSKQRHRKAKGGEADFGSPVADYKADENSKPERRVNAPKIEGAAEEKKRGGRAKRKSGGSVKHLEKGEDMKHAKHVGNVQGSCNTHAGRAPRKSGGRTGSNFNPMSSAHAGTPPRAHKSTQID